MFEFGFERHGFAKAWVKMLFWEQPLHFSSAIVSRVLKISYSNARIVGNHYFSDFPQNKHVHPQNRNESVDIGSDINQGSSCLDRLLIVSTSNTRWWCFQCETIETHEIVPTILMQFKRACMFFAFGLIVTHSCKHSGYGHHKSMNMINKTACWNANNIQTHFCPC